MCLKSQLWGDRDRDGDRDGNGDGDGDGGEDGDGDGASSGEMETESGASTGLKSQPASSVRPWTVEHTVSRRKLDII